MSEPVNSEQNNELIKEALPFIVSWYRENRRMLPWRADPSPYHCWIAEIMLQQTRIEAVIPYYTRFLQELPDIASLASVPEDRLLKLWEGLGYYSRARNLKKAAVMITEQYGGSLPASCSELKKLPGIGDYTAGAIASIAFGLPEPAVDGNVMRVLTRLTASNDDISLSSVRLKMSSLLRENYPEGDVASLLTEGMMELGEVVCLPNAQPRCSCCPVKKICRAHTEGKELCYPCIPPKKVRRTEEKTVLLLHCRGQYAIRKRTEKGLLSGLWEFPNIDGCLSLQETEKLLQPLEIIPCGSSRHIFTHVEWHMTGYWLNLSEISPRYLWKRPEEIRNDYSLPTAFRFYQNQLNSFL